MNAPVYEEHARARMAYLVAALQQDPIATLAAFNRFSTGVPVDTIKNPWAQSMDLQSYASSQARVRASAEGILPVTAAIFCPGCSCLHETVPSHADLTDPTKRNAFLTRVCGKRQAQVLKRSYHENDIVNVPAPLHD